jgi:hypothetical protein
MTTKKSKPTWVTIFGARVRKGGALWRWFKAHAPHVLPKPKPKPRPSHSLKSRVLTLASKELGVKENPAGSNRQKFGAWYGLNGEPWCAIFVSYVLSHCGRPFKYAGVPLILEAARAGQDGLEVIPFSKVKASLRAGHVVLACYDWPGESPGVPDHVGFVSGMLSPVTFQAIEGNTSSSSSGSQSNGGEVCRKSRALTDVEAFVLVK